MASEVLEAGHEDRHNRHPLDGLVRDPSDERPLCGEAEFAVIVEGMVADGAPRVFGIVQEYGTRVDAWVAGWGLVFEDGHAEVVSVDGSHRHGGGTPEEMLRGFGFGTHIRPRLVWFNPDAVTPDVEDDED